MRNIVVISALLLGTIIYAGCTKCGCTDPDAINYRKSAQEDDGSCAYSSSKIVGKYICTRESSYENTTDENIVLEIFPVRTSKKLLRAWDSSLNLTFFMTYDKNGNFRDTALAQGLPGYTKLAYGHDGSVKRYETLAYGTYDKSESIQLSYNYYKSTPYNTYISARYVYTGAKIKKYPATFVTPDYRVQRIGTYEGTKRVSSALGPAGMQEITENTTNVTLEVSLADNDSVVRIEEIGENPYLKDDKTFYYAQVDGSLKNATHKSPYFPDRSHFSGDSLVIFYVLGYSPGGSTIAYYHCKKR